MRMEWDLMGIHPLEHSYGKQPICFDDPIILVAIFHDWVNFPFRAQHLGDPRGLDTWSGTYVLKKNLPTGNLT